MIKQSQLIFLFNLVILSTTIIISDKNTQITKVHHKTQAIKSAQLRQNPSNKCDLVCPGQPPLPLPANFLHNCTSISNTPTTIKPTITTPITTTKPNITTVNSTSTEESGEESSEEDTDTSTATTKSGKSTQSRKFKKKHLKKTKTHHRDRKHIRKERILLNRKAKSKIFKHKQMQGKMRLDGCYVICSDGNEQPGSNSPPTNLPNESENEESNSDENDNYVPGEDTPIEIIYVPHRRQNHARPVDIYQTNNYWNEMWQPEPAPFDYDLFPFEEKKNIKKIKKKSYNKKKPNKQT